MVSQGFKVASRFLKVLKMQSILTRCKKICREILFHLPYRTRQKFHSVRHVTTVLYSTDLRWLVIHFLCISIFDFIICEYLCTWVINCWNGPRCHVDSVLGWAQSDILFLNGHVILKLRRRKAKIRHERMHCRAQCTAANLLVLRSFDVKSLMWATTAVTWS